MASAALSPRMSAAPIAESLYALPSNLATDTAMSSTSSLFDDLVDWPSSPRPSHMISQSVAMSPESAAVASPTPAPPATTDPETLFRHYLTIELRKMGSEPDQALVDHYVRQHAQSLSRARSTAFETAAVQSCSDAAPAYPTMDIESTSAQHSALSPPESSTSTTTSPNLIASRSFSLSPVPDEDEADMSGTSTLCSDVDMSPFKVKVEETSSSTTIDPTMTQLPAQKAQSMASITNDMVDDKEKSPMRPLQPVTQAQQDANTVILEQLSNAAQEQKPFQMTPSKSIGGEEDPDEELRTNPEQYAKLSSKEKRQLRNKLSARNFRERRKEYITHLEGQLADRDAIIDGLRAELANVKGERQSLADEVRSLRASAASRPASSGPAMITQADVARILDALQRNNSAGAQTSSSDNAAASSSSRPPTPSSASFANSSVRPNSPRPHLSSAPSSSSLVQANTRKDSFASRMTSSDGSSGKGVGSFWGGAQGNGTAPFGGVGSGFMSVHTTLVPPSEQALASVMRHFEGMPLKGSFKGKSTSDQRLLDALSGLSISTKKGGLAAKSAKHLSTSSADSFDVYDAFASVLRNDAGQKAGESSAHDDTPPPTYEAAVAVGPSPAPAASSTASDALSDRLLGALERAFAASPSSSSKGSAPSPSSIDANKIAAMLDGRAELRLVDTRTGNLFGSAPVFSSERRGRRASTGAVEVAACA